MSLRPNRPGTIAALAFLFTCGTFAAAQADEDQTAVVRLEYWDFNVDGDATVHGSETGVDDANRVVNGRNNGFVLYGDKRFDSGNGLNVDVFIGRQRTSKQISDSESADFAADYTIFTGNGYLSLLDKDFEDPEKTLKIDASAGLRGFTNSYRLDFNPYDQYNSKNRSDAVSWVDLCAGLRLESQITHHFGVELYADAGGFGIGSSSELSVLSHIAAIWKLSPAVDVSAGYRVMDLKSGNQSGDRATELDIQMRGFTLGIEGRF